MSAGDERPTADQPGGAGGADDGIRRRAIRQIERRRRFHAELVTSGIGMLLLVAIWATTEYQNSGGWPTDGFSQSSGIPNVWNVWIVYPVIAWVLVMAARAWTVYGRRPISDAEIQREIERQNGTRAR